MVSYDQIKIKQEALDDITEIITSLDSEATVTAFGSFVTGLQFPDSDIDINIESPNITNPKSMLNKLFKACRRTRSVDINKIEYVSHAKIPVLKVVHTNTTPIDITCLNDCSSSDRTVVWIKKYPELRILFLLLKQLLSYVRIRELGGFKCMSAAHQGLAGYTLICLIVSYLQRIAPKIKHINSKNKYGKLLVGFLQHYSAFDYDTYAISLDQEGELLKLSTLPNMKKNEPKLYIINPDDEQMNVSRATNIKAVQFVFTKLHDLLLDNMKLQPHYILPCIADIREDKTIVYKRINLSGFVDSRYYDNYREYPQKRKYQSNDYSPFNSYRPMAYPYKKYRYN